MIFDRGFDDPAATLWMTMLAIQSLPYVATVTTAGREVRRPPGDRAWR
jgi:hypothetical protein